MNELPSNWVWWAAGGAVVLVGGYLVLRPSSAQAASVPTLPTRTTQRASTPVPAPPRPTPLPPPPPGVIETGAQFAQRIQSLTGAARERAIRDAVLRGNVPSFLNTYAPVNTSIPGHSGTFFVTPDYLGVGVDGDWLRTPMYPLTAQQVVDARNELLPTKHMVDIIHQQAPTKITFTAKNPDVEHVARDSSVMYKRENDSIETKLAGRSGLTAGQKKDIVIGALLARSPGKVIIYGAWDANGARIQPYSNVHSSTYVDYSHGIRGVKETMMVDGHEMRVADVLADPALAGLLSDEGVVTRGIRYLS